jgi:hypothetical protein
MRTRLSFLIITSLLLGLISLSPAANSLNTNLEIQAITDSNSGEVRLTFNSKIARASVRSYSITATPNTPSAASYSKTFTRKVSGYVLQRVTALTPGTDYKFRVSIRTTNNRVINSADFNFYTRSIKPTTPVITRAFETDSDEAVIYFDAPANDGQTPVLYYTAVATPGGATGTTLQQGSGSITITGLTKSTTYTFTITAHNINGTSVESRPSQPVTTLANKIVRVVAASSSGGSTLAAPAFTLSRNAETRTVGVTNAGYSITPSGGTIDSYTITPALPAGLTFSSSTGLISGIPTETKTATTHTITATNATGSASNTLRLRVTGDIGDVGPGGGRIFYYSAAGFSCGPTRAATCKYLEVAPNGWNGGADSAVTWAQAPFSSSAAENRLNLSTLLGYGSQNTKAIIDQGNTNVASSAAAFAQSYSATVEGVNVNDWFLPSENELLSLYTQRVAVAIQFSSGSGIHYWSSSSNNNENGKYVHVATSFVGTASGAVKTTPHYVRPIRAF